jgi:hypothetical protein
MVAREILIMNTKDQGKYRVVTDAVTLDEFKSVLTRNEGVFKKVGNEWIANPTPISISDMSFTEGITKAEYRDGSALIPENVPFKGGMASPVFLLTNTTKKIASGAYPTDRKLFGDYIKKNNLGGAIQEKFGNNWTRVKTASLIEFFKGFGKTKKKEELENVREEVANVGKQEEKKEEEVVNTSTPETKLPEVKTAPHASTVNWLYDGVKAMAKENTLYVEDVIVLADLINDLAHRLYEEKPVVTDDDLDNMLDDIMG